MNFNLRHVFRDKFLKLLPHFLGSNELKTGLQVTEVSNASNGNQGNMPYSWKVTHLVTPEWPISELDEKVSRN